MVESEGGEVLLMAVLQLVLPPVIKLYIDAAENADAQALAVNANGQVVADKAIAALLLPLMCLPVLCC